VKKKFFIIAVRIFCFLGLLIFMTDRVKAQEMPPRPVSVSLIRNLNFGAFTQGTSGGSVILYPSGSRTSMGDIILINFGYLYYPAIFELEGNPGTIVHLMAGSPAVLTGDHGGAMNMVPGDSEPVTPLILPLTSHGVLQVFIGGILTVGNPLANPMGHYSGTFNVMFIQE
jgi:hypothetical protein